MATDRASAWQDRRDDAHYSTKPFRGILAAQVEKIAFS